MKIFRGVQWAGELFIKLFQNKHKTLVGYPTANTAFPNLIKIFR